MPPTNPKAPKQIEATTHADTRVNIPTEELRDFVAKDEAAPKTLLYPRDPSLDPQLVWRGKDEQDRENLAVPAVPIYIQEKIHPRAIIEDLRAESKKGAPPAEQLGLFSDFNGLSFDQQVEFYQHDQHWSNRMILGDSLLVMASLAEKEGLKGKVQMIYMDPPYGIKFGSNWQVSTRKRDVRDGNAADVNREPEVVRAFRDTWQLGIHSYLSYLRDRLALSRELLSESGSIFVQIGDENVHLVRGVMDEVFGPENFISLVPFIKTGGQAASLLPAVVDYLLFYGKDRSSTKYRALFQAKERGGTGSGEYSWIELPNGARRRITSQENDDEASVPEASRYFIPDNLTSADVSESGTFTYELSGGTFFPRGGHWKTSRPGLDRLAAAGRTIVQGVTLRYVRYFDDFPVSPISNAWLDTGARGWGEGKIYVVQTVQRVVERCILMSTDPGDLVFDPTCGSGTTAYIAEQWGRRWITTDTSRVALALAPTRLMTSRFSYYVLSDSPEGVRKEVEATGQAPPPYKTASDIKKGFVYKRVPHITLKSIANNEEIDVIHERFQENLEQLRARLNQLAGTSWHEWEMPTQRDKAWPSPAENVFADWWKLRRERQAEIDASIARRADIELLYDQPYEDDKRVRVTGPFTVESLSPHRMISVEDKVVAAQDGSRPPGAASPCR
jgi:adenine-specific DNA-methyltransferase